MAMEHKAFSFDFPAFDSELRPILEGALSSADCMSLVRFMEKHLNELADPYEGEPLDDDWESLIEQADVHQYGDFALTKYYDPTADIGLGPAWDEIQEAIHGHPNLTESPILGSVLGPQDQPFNPGKMGSYFQSEEQVKKNRQFLIALANDSDAFQEAIDMLAQAEEANKGLYVTF